MTRRAFFTLMAAALKPKPTSLFTFYPNSGRFVRVGPIETGYEWTPNGMVPLRWWMTAPIETVSVDWAKSRLPSR